MSPSKKKPTIAIIGLGYVGLPTLVAIAKTNQYHITGFDIDKSKIKQLKSNINPIDDQDVNQFLANSHQVNFTHQPNDLKTANIYIIAVPTPVKDDYIPDYSYIESACQTIAPLIQPGNHLVLESTVNPGTCDEIVIPLIEKISQLSATKDFNVAHCPERINPGDPKWNIYNIDRNIGSSNPTLSTQITDFYRTFITKAVIHQRTNLKVTESSKIVENTFRDINIAFVNELAQSFDAMGIDLHETIQAASNKPFGYMAHWPSRGVGGHCIAVDPYYLIKHAAQSGFDHRFLKLARDINNYMPTYTVSKVTNGLNQLKQSVNGSSIAVLGLSYKANVSDDRESPAYQIIDQLQNLGAKVTPHDPFVQSKPHSLKQLVNNHNVLVIATNHDQYLQQLPKLLPNSKVKLIIDGLNCLDKHQIQSQNIIYQGIGR